MPDLHAVKPVTSANKTVVSKKRSARGFVPLLPSSFTAEVKKVLILEDFVTPEALFVFSFSLSSNS